MLAERLNCLDFEGVENLGDMGGRLSSAPPPLSSLLSAYAGAPLPSPFSKPPPPVLLLKMFAAHSGNGDLGEISGVGDRPGVEGNWIPKVVEAVETGGTPLWVRRWCRGGLRASASRVGRWGFAGRTGGQHRSRVILGRKAREHVRDMVGKWCTNDQPSSTTPALL